MCGQENIWSRVCGDRPTYRQSVMSNNEIKGLLNLADIFCFRLYVRIPLFKPFLKYWHFFDRQTDRPTKKAIIEAPPRSLKKL